MKLRASRSFVAFETTKSVSSRSAPHSREAPPMTDHTLYLLRHAKSSWDEPLADGTSVRWPPEASGTPGPPGACSPTAAGGRTWCCVLHRRTRLADLAAGRGRRRPGRARCATSTRSTRRPSARLLDLVQQAPEEIVGSLMLVGHGPGLPGLAESPRRPAGAAPGVGAVWNAKYPTAGLAVLRLGRLRADADARTGRAGGVQGPRG